MGKESRIDYIDYAKAIGIILVVIGHINEYNSPCKAWLYAFHMPLFFIISGMFLKPIKDFRTFVDKRVRRLLVPYFVWGLIFAELSYKNILYVCYGSHQTLFAAHSLSSLWFFAVLFVAYIMAELVINRCKGNAILPKILGGGSNGYWVLSAKNQAWIPMGHKHSIRGIWFYDGGEMCV